MVVLLLLQIVVPKPGVVVGVGSATKTSSSKQEQRSRPGSVLSPVPFLAAVQVAQRSPSSSPSPHPLPLAPLSPLSPLPATMSDYDSTNGDASVSLPPRDNGSSVSPQPVPEQQQHGLSPIIRKKLMGFVGFANLPNQVHRKSVRKGFQFTAMVVGTYQHVAFTSERFSLFAQASLVSASRRSLTPSSTPRCTRPRFPFPPARSVLRPSPSRALVPVSNTL